MAIDFPANPTTGQQSNGFTYDGTKWKATTTSVAPSTVSATPPANPTVGDMWFNANDGTLYFYYNDGNTSQWVESRAPITANGYYSPNYIINGGFDIWQRGTSVTNCGEGIYFADRWAPNEYQTNRVSRVLVTAGQGPVSQYAIRSASRGSASRQVVYQKIESVNSIPLRGKTVTLSFWLRASAASWSSSGTPYDGFRYYLGFNTTTTDAPIGQAGGGFDTSETAMIANGSLPTSWKKYSITAVVPLTANNIAVRFGTHADGTATADTNWFEITDVQLEEGTSATTFRRNANSIQGELAACQRYYNRITAQPGNNSGMIFGFQQTLATSRFVYSAPVKFRTVPSISFTNCDISDDITFATPITSFAVYSQSDPQAPYLILNHASSGSQNRPVVVRSQQANTSFIEFNAEL